MYLKFLIEITGLRFASDFRLLQTLNNQLLQISSFFLNRDVFELKYISAGFTKTNFEILRFQLINATFNGNVF
jgi:hypothetical protein